MKTPIRKYLTLTSFIVAALVMAPTHAADAPYPTRQAWISYTSARDKLEIPTLLIAPKEKGAYPAMLYIHGRWGLNDAIVKQLKAIAERGIVILAPDYYFARAIPVLAPFNDSDTTDDIDAAIPFFKSLLPQVTTEVTKPLAILAEDHGGYHAILIGTRRPNDIGAIAGFYPLVQDPNAAKPKQLYQYMPEIDQLKAPTLFLIGGHEREMRRIGVGRVVNRLRELKRSVTYIEYPGAQRCFEWTASGHLPDTMGRRDAINQIVKFVNKNIGGRGLLMLEAEGWTAL